MIIQFYVIIENLRERLTHKRRGDRKIKKKDKDKFKKKERNKKIK